VAYTRLVVISTDGELELNEFRDSVDAELPFLADPGRTIQKDLDIVEYTDPVHDPMIPQPSCWPRLGSRGSTTCYSYWGRPTVEELHRDLRAVMRETRPDLDLAAPGLREAWDRVEAERFLVTPVEGAAICYTEGMDVGVKR
jgi:hypothetical protein